LQIPVPAIHDAPPSFDEFDVSTHDHLTHHGIHPGGSLLME
jgi:hypothetical protein